MLLATFPYLAVIVGLILLREAWLSILAYHALILLAWRLRPRSIAFRPLGDRRIWIPSALSCLSAGAFLIALWPWVNRGEVGLGAWLAEHGLQGTAWALFLPYFALVHPLLEEIHWRGLESESAGLIAWTDLAFAGYHVLVLHALLQPIWLVFVLVLLSLSSAAWRATSRMNRSLGFAVSTHVLADASVIVAAFILSRGH